MGERKRKKIPLFDTLEKTCQDGFLVTDAGGNPWI